MHEPAYRVVRHELRRAILAGDYPIGSTLPALPHLERAFHVSSSVVRRALQELRHEGLVEIRHGVGTFVVATTPAARGDGCGCAADLHALRLDVARLAARVAHLEQRHTPAGENARHS